jgi:hypothetical protein
VPEHFFECNPRGVEDKEDLLDSTSICVHFFKLATVDGQLDEYRWQDPGNGRRRKQNVPSNVRLRPEQTFPSPQLSGYANIIQPARNTWRKMEMSKSFDGSTVSGHICGEV